MNPTIIRMLGVYLVTDGWFSLNCYIGKAGQVWWRDHSIRIVRILIGITMMIWG